MEEEGYHDFSKLMKQAFLQLDYKVKHTLLNLVMNKVKDKFPCIKKYNTKIYKWWWRFGSLKDYTLKINLLVRESEYVMDSMVNNIQLKDFVLSKYEKYIMGCKVKVEIEYEKED